MLLFAPSLYVAMFWLPIICIIMQVDPMLLMQQQICATNARLDRVISMLTEVKADVQKFMLDVNRSSSTTGGIKYPCPMQCGAEFKKVGVRAIALNPKP